MHGYQVSSILFGDTMGIEPNNGESNGKENGT